MKIYKIIYQLLLLCFVSLSVNTGVHAALIVQDTTGSFSVNGGGDFVSQADDSTPAILGFDLFDSSLGVLNSVSMVFESTLNMDADLFNPTEVGNSYGFDVFYGYIAGLNNGASGGIGNNANDHVSGFLNASSSVSHSWSHIFNESLSYSGSELSLFTGSGSFTMNASMGYDASFGISTPPSMEYPYHLVAEELIIAATLIYDYTEVTSRVPESKTIHLFLLGLVALALMRIRANRKSGFRFVV